MLDAILPKLLEYGWPGIFLGFLLYLLIRRDQRLDELQREVRDLQEKRIEEAMKSVEALREASEVGESCASALTRVSLVLDRDRDRDRSGRK